MRARLDDGWRRKDQSPHHRTRSQWALWWDQSIVNQDLTRDQGPPAADFVTRSKSVYPGYDARWVAVE